MAELVLGAVSLGVQLAPIIQKLWRATERLTDEGREVREFLNHLTETLRCLDSVFRSLKETLNDPQVYESEDKDHIDTIKTMIYSCSYTITKLRDTLPDVEEDAGGFQAIWVGFEKTVKYKTVEKYERCIQRYTDMMQLTLVAMTFRRTALNQGLNVTTNDEELTLVENIDRWCNNFPSAMKDASRSGSDIASLNQARAPNEDRTRVPTQFDIIKERSLAMKKDTVGGLEQQGRFLKAAVKQDECIHDRRQLDRVRPLLFEEEADMKEHMADLLMRCSTVGLHQQALEVLMRILDDAKHQPVSLAMTERLGRLHYKIAELNLSQHKLGKLSDKKRGLEHAEQAFHMFDKLDIPEAQPYPNPDFLKAAKLFARSPAFEELVTLWGESKKVAKVDLTWDPDQDDPIPMSLEWCKTQGYNTSCPTFRFDALRDGTSPLHKVVMSDDSESLQALEQMLVEIKDEERIDLRDAKGHTPLQVAAKTGNHQAVRVLIDHGASIRVVDNKGRSALHLCEEADHSSSDATAEILLKNEPDLLDFQDSTGHTSLYLACEHGHKQLATCLLKHGADPKIANSEGTTALLAAVKNYDSKNSDRRKIIWLLLTPGPTQLPADPNQQNIVGHSPLHIACVKGHVDLVGLLLRSGAMRNLRHNTELPADVAKRRGHMEIYKMLTRKNIPPLSGTMTWSRRTSQGSGTSEESTSGLRPAQTMPAPAVHRHLGNRGSTATQ